MSATLHGMRATVVLAGSVLVLAACSGTAAEDSTEPAGLPDCSTVGCVGILDGAAFEIVLPEEWNGTLLIYSHGYRPQEPLPPFFDAVAEGAVPAPGWDAQDTGIGDALLARGYALAGSAYASNGWAVEDGVKAATDLYTYFADTIARPERTYVWGDSLGGLITTVLAERGPEWLTGAASLCGVMSGVLDNFDLALDITYTLRELLYPDLQITGFESYTEALLAWEGAASAIVEGARSADTDTIAALLAAAAVADAPRQTGQFDGSDVVSLVSGTVESLLTALAYGTVARQEAEVRFGGGLSGNVGIDYAARFSPEERATIDGFGGVGTVDRFIAALASGERITADTAAVAAASERGGSPTGAIQVPMITMHTVADPLVIVQNQARYRDLYAQAAESGAASADLVQIYIAPPATYSTDGAPYGAGHCNFTAASRIGIVDLLDGWVREGRYPGQASTTEALGSGSGYSPLFTPTPWPRAA